MTFPRVHARAVVGALAALVTAATVAAAAPSDGRPARSGASTAVWKRVFSDSFSGDSLDTSKWGVYGQNQRSASNTFVTNGHLVLRTTRINGAWKAAGVSSARALEQTYGRYVIRARLDKAVGTRAVALLWPAGGGWPPEIDFYEIGGQQAARTKNYLTNHYSASNLMQHDVATADFSDWHRIAVTWSPKRIVYRTDGVVTAVQSGHSPSTKMWLGLQSAVGTGDEAPDASTPDDVDFVVDWVRVYHRVR